MAESPTHYTRGSIEVWDFIRDQDLNYHLGNAIKYICRAGFKGDNTKTEDLKKAIHYLENELQHTALHEPKPGRSSNSIPQLVWDPELIGQPDYATGFDR
tara:strand:+ start:438 stop:737 length:300 start_codon:yes stop_codon:yes gene_type:complete